MAASRLNDWDFVVIGAGSAGCAVAHELAQSGHNRVLVLEAGGHDRSLCIKIPALVAKACDRFNWGYTSEPDPSRGGRTEKWLRGNVLGGSSSINGTVFVRGARYDFDRWAALGNEGWSYDEVLPLYQEMETYEHIGSSRGSCGPLQVRRVEDVHPLTEAFIRSSAASGFFFNADYNGSMQEGISYAQLSQRRGLRCSSADAFLSPLQRSFNSKLLLNAHVDRILFDAGKAVGVSFRRGDVSRTVSAGHILMCAGAINTPKLLMLSGIGDAAELNRHGISVVADMPEVGRNLQEHPLVRVIYRSRIGSHNLTRGIRQRIEIVTQFGLRRQGPISTLFEAIGFVKTSADLHQPDIQIHFSPMGYLDPINDASPLLKFPSLSVLINKSHPRSRGRVRLAGSSSDAAPLIECNLLGDSDDRETLVRGIELVRRIMKTSPMADLIEQEVVPGAGTSSRDALERYVPSHTEIGYHPVGTCRMGPDSAAVVTPQLRVNGFRNLWIADASIMPDLISGNTNAVCMMIGMKLGRFLKNKSIDARY
jgi:choline dehydrogenase